MILICPRLTTNIDRKVELILVPAVDDADVEGAPNDESGFAVRFRIPMS